MKSQIRIANGQGFWGDWLEAPVRQVEQGPIDYLVLDYLAEVTMSIHADAGWARRAGSGRRNPRRSPDPDPVAAASAGWTS
jgi:hypothetical protein